MPTVRHSSTLLMRNFARSHPATYLRWFPQGLESRGPLDEDVAFQPRMRLAALNRRANRLNEADREAREPAYFNECEPIPNVAFSAVLQSALLESNRRYQLQIYTVQRGTHRGKRLFKARTESGLYKAVGFLNRNATFTPWVNSVWAEDDLLHDVIREFLVRYTSDQVSLSAAMAMQSRAIRVAFIFDADDFRCLCCNSMTPEGSRICNVHLPSATLGVDCVTNYTVISEAEERQERLRERRDRERRELAERQERERQEQERQQQQQQEEWSQQLLSEFTPLLSENGTGAIR